MLSHVNKIEQIRRKHFNNQVLPLKNASYTELILGREIAL